MYSLNGRTNAEKSEVMVLKDIHDIAFDICS